MKVKLNLRTTGVVLFDLDNLKVINDNFGHEKGDEALKLCYQCISQAFQNVKNCFRIGGDEFAYVYHSDEKIKSGAEIYTGADLKRKQRK